MSANRKFQMKEIMQIFDISRDVIKYYEQAGLITSERLENGYRVFDELNMLKLKKALHFRSLNMTVEEISQHFEAEDPLERMAIMRNVRQRTEQEILALNKKLRKIRLTEQAVGKNLQYIHGLNAAGPLSVCVNCPHLKDSEDRIFYFKIGLQAKLSPMGDLLEMRYCNLVTRSEAICEACSSCDRKMKFKENYRSRIRYQSQAHMEAEIRNAVDVIRQQGMILDGRVFIILETLKDSGEDVRIVDIQLPLADESPDLTCAQPTGI